MTTGSSNWAGTDRRLAPCRPRWRADHYAAGVAYRRENLHADEELILDLHPHWWYFTPSLTVLVIAVVGSIAVLVRTDWDALQLIAAAGVVVSLVWFVTRYIQWATTDLVLTTDRLIWRQGVIAKQGIEIPIDRINTIFFFQKIWERLLGVGDLMVESASASGEQRFENMRQPSRIQNEIYIQKEAFDRRRLDRSVASAPAPDRSAADRLMRLNELREAGAISDEEFAAKKSQLLEEL
jgi:uncharacterized membrane protein YdbT with pleckstrin-like domain